MAVALTAAQRAALRGHAIAIRTLIDVHLDSGRYSFWDGHTNEAFDGTTYVAAGALAWIEPITMGRDLGAEGMVVTLDGSRLVAGVPEAGDPAALLGTIEAETYQLRRVDIRFAFFSTETGELILTLRRYSGLIDQIQIVEEIDEDTGRVAVLMRMQLESIARRYGRRGGRTRSHDDQQEIWPGDTGFKYTASAIAKQGTLFWGRKPPSPEGKQGGIFGLIGGKPDWL